MCLQNRSSSGRKAAQTLGTDERTSLPKGGASSCELDPSVPRLVSVTLLLKCISCRRAFSKNKYRKNTCFSLLGCSIIVGLCFGIVQQVFMKEQFRPGPLRCKHRSIQNKNIWLAKLKLLSFVSFIWKVKAIWRPGLSRLCRLESSVSCEGRWAIYLMITFLSILFTKLAINLLLSCRETYS